jgi:predicted permease
VLLIACANVANLMLARTDARGREIAVRSALGAKKIRIVRLLLAEAVVISATGGALGLLAAFVGIRGVLAFVFPEPVPGVGSVDLNGRVLVFTFAVTGFTALLFGLGPAIRGSARNLVDTLKSGSSSSTSGQRGHIRKLLVISQVSLAIALLVGSGLLIKAFVQMQTLEFGFDRENLFTFRVSLPDAGYPNAEAVAGFHLELLDRLANLPNAVSVTGASSLPLHATEYSGYSLPGMELPGDRPAPRVAHRAVLPEYFETMRLDVISGRAFDRNDGSTMPAVVILNEAMAERHWPGGSPLGLQIRLADRTHEIVGVVENAINQFGPNVEPIVYTPSLQLSKHAMLFVVRTSAEHAGMLEAVRSEVSQVDPNLAAYGARLMDDQVNAGLLEVGVVVSMMLLAAAIAVLLALTGVYGVVSYSVAQRTRELGIRMALGAGGDAIVGLILRQGGFLAAAGLGSGLVVAVLLSKGMAGMLFGVSSTDPIVFGVVLVAVFLTCLVASFAPAKRAARVDPLEAIRYE